MADISIQFHALRHELLPLVKQSMSDFDLHVVAMTYFPFTAVTLSMGDLDRIFADPSTYRELAFTLEKAKLPVKTNEFLDLNPDALALQIQSVAENGLRQSWLGCRTTNEAALSAWKKITRRLKRITSAGVTVTNPKTGAHAQYRTFRYTAGAKALEFTGVPMLPAAGGCIVKFGIDEDK